MRVEFTRFFLTFSNIISVSIAEQYFQYAIHQITPLHTFVLPARLGCMSYPCACQENILNDKIPNSTKQFMHTILKRQSFKKQFSHRRSTFRRSGNVNTNEISTGSQATEGKIICYAHACSLRIHRLLYAPVPKPFQDVFYQSSTSC